MYLIYEQQLQYVTNVQALTLKHTQSRQVENGL